MMERPGPAPKAGAGWRLAAALWRRRKWLMLPIFLIPLAVVAGMVRTLPDIYESTATVLVGQPRGPLDQPGGASAAGEVETRIRIIKEQVLSRMWLGELVSRFGLYPDLRSQATPDEVVRRMRGDIRVDFTEAQDQFSWRTVTIGVALSYRSRDPQTAAGVANALAARFVDENARIRRRYAAGTAQYLRAEVEAARRGLDALDRGRQDQAYAAAAQRYQVLLQRYEEAALAERLAQAQPAELRVLDPAVPSPEPVAPRRLVILLMGAMMSTGAAVGVGLLAEARDTSFHTADDLRTFTSLPILAAIPPIVTRSDAWRRAALAALGAAALGVAVAAAGMASSRLAQGSELLVRVLTPDRF